MPPVLTLVLIAGGAVAVILAGAMVWFRIRYGGRGRRFPDLSTPPLLSSDVVEVVATLAEPPGNLTVSAKGRVFSTYHAESRPTIKVFELVDGKPVPYPDMAWQSKRRGAPYFDQIFNVRVDRQERLWTLDHGFHGTRTPRLLAFDLETDELVHQFDFPPSAAGKGSYIQDMQIDSAGRHIYIADIGVMAKKPAIVIYDTFTRTARRVLERDRSVTAQDFEINSKGRRMYLLGGLYWMHPDLDPIALDKKDEWLYFGAMSADTLYRARTADLNNASLSAQELSRRVEVYAAKSQCDGISIDLDDNIYVTSIEDGAINIIGPDRIQRTLVKHPAFRWPDGLSFGPDDYLYIADSDVPDLMMRSKRHTRSAAPFHIFRFKPGYQSIPGH